MKDLTCAGTRRRLHAFHDEELPVADQIAVSAHLEWCETCASAFADLRLLRTAVRTVARERMTLCAEDDLSFQRSIVDRMKAEEGISFGVRVRSMFEDMRLVYAGLGSALAAVACVTMMLNMMRFATTEERPDSLAALVNALASPEVDESVTNTDVVDARLLLPRYTGATFAADSESEMEGFDAEFALAGVVTREGRVANLELVNVKSGQPVAPGTDEAQALQNMMRAISRARYEPARVDGLPVAVDKVWLVPHTTVHASEKSLDPPISLAAKKRVTTMRGSSPASTSSAV